MFDIRRVTLTVHDLDAVSAYYQTAIGLHPIEAGAGTALLGVGSQVLLELRRDPAAKRHAHSDAGLFHTAFLLPARADLARWTKHAIATKTPVAGASDHAVSEAIYLTDPEGNGIEIYRDRPREAWVWNEGGVVMTTEALDIPGLLTAAGDASWQGFPEGAKIGHVHLQVGDIPAAEAFYTGALGLGVTRRVPAATFYAVDGYHHQLATNVWNSRGAPKRTEPTTGLAEVEIATGNPGVFHDPWGTTFRLT